MDEDRQVVPGVVHNVWPARSPVSYAFPIRAQPPGQAHLHPSEKGETFFYLRIVDSMSQKKGRPGLTSPMGDQSSVIFWFSEGFEGKDEGTLRVMGLAHNELG
ncbi:hypothetical protein CORC01_04393 [Colletotrichum orchidophilum]|uniref:Uncharacterized protein n=1 Tax=Colletotrichum orchidophilum TaxID=1209926 RepID=A0A1G4BFN8_9PEZI|nr:uncharacterized protein CORC01_04393 [Colletotrichum orchidophilum]OHF00204.1 hypothetical protein CORC01_04393 [Colletotrichum orchidophilum]